MRLEQPTVQSAAPGRRTPSPCRGVLKSFQPFGPVPLDPRRTVASPYSRIDAVCAAPQPRAGKETARVSPETRPIRVAIPLRLVGAPARPAHPLAPRVNRMSGPLP